MPTQQDPGSNKKALAWLIALLLVQAILACLVLAWPGLQQADSRMSAALALAPDSPARVPVSWITMLGSGTLALPAILSLSVVLLVRDRSWRAVSLWAGFLAARVVTDGLKIAVGRARPSLPELGYVPDGWNTLSFPSGHATSATYFFGFVAILCMTLPLSTLVKRILAGALMLVAVAVACSRVLLGRHFPVDVIGGFVSAGIGLAVAVLVANTLQGSRGFMGRNG